VTAPLSATAALTALARVELVRRPGRGEYRTAEPFLTEWVQMYES
jgi:hypothetical protein